SSHVWVQTMGPDFPAVSGTITRTFTTAFWGRDWLTLTSTRVADTSSGPANAGGRCRVYQLYRTRSCVGAVSWRISGRSLLSQARAKGSARAPSSLGSSTGAAATAARLERWASTHPVAAAAGTSSAVAVAAQASHRGDDLRRGPSL